MKIKYLIVFSTIMTSLGLEAGGNYPGGREGAPRNVEQRIRRQRHRTTRVPNMLQRQYLVNVKSVE